MKDHFLVKRILSFGLTACFTTHSLISQESEAPTRKSNVENASSSKSNKKPNIVFIMTDDVGWGDLGCYGGGETRGCKTPHLDRMAKEGLRFTNYYGQASCTAGRASFITGRIPIRTALSTVLAPGDLNGLEKEDPTVAEALKKLGYQTAQWGKWHLGDQPKNFPTEHGFDEMKYMLPYYAGVYAYDYLPLQPDFPIQIGRASCRERVSSPV